MSRQTEFAPPSDDADLPQHLVRRALRDYWLSMVLIGLIVSVAGVAFAISRPQTMTSSTEVLLAPLAGNPFSPDAVSNPQQVTVGLETEADLISSPEVTQLVGRALGTSVPAGTNRVTAKVVTNSQIVQISYSAPSVATAQTGVKAVADAFLQVRRDRAQTLRDNQVADLLRQQASLEQQLNAAAKKTDSAARTAQLQSLTNRLADVEDSLGTARAMATDPGSVITEPSTPGSLQEFTPLLIAILSVLLGFGAGLAIGVLRAWSDDRIDSSHDVYVRGVPIWAAMGDSVRGQNYGLLTQDDQEAKEAYRRLRAAVLANAHRGSVIAVTSSTSLPGIADIGSNLAVALQDAGYDCALVDAEITDPAVADLFGLPEHAGVADIIGGAVNLDAAVAVRHGVAVLTAGSDPDAVLERYSGEAFRSTLDTLRAQYDYVIMAVADLSTAVGVTAAAVADCVLLAAVDRVATRGDVAETLARSATDNVSIRGIVTISPRAVKNARPRMSRGALESHEPSHQAVPEKQGPTEKPDRTDVLPGARHISAGRAGGKVHDL